MVPLHDGIAVAVGRAEVVAALLATLDVVLTTAVSVLWGLEVAADEVGGAEELDAMAEVDGC